MSSGEPVERALVALYDFVTGQRSFEETLTRIVVVTAESLAADAGGVTMLDQNDRPATVGCTDPVVAEIDEAQYQADAGPCVEAMRTGRVVRSDDLEAESRWPDFARVASAHGFRSVLSMPLPGADGTDGSLNAYAHRPEAFGEAAEEFGLAFA